MRILALVIALVTIARGATASPSQDADPAGIPFAAPLPPGSAPAVPRWYGWEIVLADAGVLALAAGTRDPWWLLGWTISGTIVHAANGHGTLAFHSVLARVGLPIMGALVGGLANSGCRGDLCGLGGVLGGGLAGVAVAEIYDLATAHDELATVAARPPARGWTPVVSPRGAGATLGVVAAF